MYTAVQKYGIFLHTRQSKHFPYFCTAAVHVHLHPVCTCVIVYCAIPVFCDIPSDATQLNLPGLPLCAINTTQNQQGVAADVTTSLDIDCALSVDMNLCASSDSNYLCLFIGPEPATASFSDDVTGNNVACSSMATTKNCAPGT